MYTVQYMEDRHKLTNRIHHWSFFYHSPGKNT